MKPPQSVLLAADGYLSEISYIKYLGVYENMPAWTIEYTEPVTIGYPVVFLEDGDQLKIVRGEESLKIYAYFCDAEEDD